MNQKPKAKRTTPNKKARPIPVRAGSISSAKTILSKDEDSTTTTLSLLPVKEETPEAGISEEVQDEERERELFKSEAERFIEVSKYFSNPFRKTASYICENRLVSYPNPYRIEYKRGGITTQHIKFSNLTLEPVYIRLYKLIPDLEQLKYINLSLSRCKRIPPGLSFNLGFVYDDVNEKPSCNAKMIFVASRKTTTPCYQICEIELQIEALKVRLVQV